MKQHGAYSLEDMPVTDFVKGGGGTRCAGSEVQNAALAPPCLGFLTFHHLLKHIINLQEAN